MKPSERYEAILPEPFRILGLKLRPLSMGHIILLEHMESPFMLAGDMPTIADLATAVLICSLTFEDAKSLIENQDLPKIVYRWGRKLVRPKWYRFWEKDKEIDFSEKLQLFMDYITYHLKQPVFDFEENGSINDIAAPAPHLIRLQLLMKTNLTESEILNRPWRLCIEDLLTMKAMEGQLRLMDEGELKEAQELANRLQRLQDNNRT